MCEPRGWQVQAGAAVALGLGLLLGGSALAAQGAGASQAGAVAPLPALTDPNVTPNLAVPAVPDTYRIGEDDLLDVFVFQMPELTSQVRVDDRGAIHLPFLATTVPASGLTSVQLADRVTQALVAAGLARRPLVQVTVRQVMSHRVVVSGAVRNPLVIQATRPISLVEALARAGGLDTQAGATVLITRPGDGGPSTQSIPMNQVLEGDVGSSLMLDGGESVRVAAARMIYAVGAVGKPGAFPIQADERLTLLKALALAQGTGDHADRSHAEIIRTTADGKTLRLQVNLDKVLQHKEADASLQAGDIFYVPDSGKAKTIGTIIADAGQMAVIAVGYNATKIF